jgi:hypothetical protein
MPSLSLAMSEESVSANQFPSAHPQGFLLAHRPHQSRSAHWMNLAQEQAPVHDR